MLAAQDESTPQSRPVNMPKEEASQPARHDDPGEGHSGAPRPLHNPQRCHSPVQRSRTLPVPPQREQISPKELGCTARLRLTASLTGRQIRIGRDSEVRRDHGVGELLSDRPQDAADRAHWQRDVEPHDDPLSHG